MTIINSLNSLLDQALLQTIDQLPAGAFSRSGRQLDYRNAFIHLLSLSSDTTEKEILDTALQNELQPVTASAFCQARDKFSPEYCRSIQQAVPLSCPPLLNIKAVLCSPAMEARSTSLFRAIFQTAVSAQRRFRVRIPTK